MAVIGAAGSIEAIAQGTVERHLDNNPVTRFVLETFHQGISEIGGRELYRTWCNWCEDTGHQAGSETLFGRRIKKLTGLVTLRKQHTRVTYAIEPAAQFDLPAHLGVKPNPLNNQRVVVKPSAPKPLAITRKTEGSDSSEGFLKNIHSLGGEDQKPMQHQVPPKPSEPSDSAQIHCATVDLGQRVEQKVAEGLAPHRPATAAEWVELATVQLAEAAQPIDAAAIHKLLRQWGAGVSRSQVEAHQKPSAAPLPERVVGQLTMFPLEEA
jgi:hypothetical protein